MTNYRCQRHRNVDAIARSSIHQSLVTPSSQIAIARCKSSTLNDPKQALDLIRSLVQTELNEKVQVLMQEYVDSVFQPAIQNIRKNLGETDQVVGALLLEEVCCNALDHAKDMFRARSKTANIVSESSVNNSSNHSLISASMATRLAVKRKLKGSIPVDNNKRRLLGQQRTDLPLVTPEGKPVRREGPKWDAKRINHDTQFILGSKACRLLGYKRGGRLYSAHTSLFKYSLDQEDKERLIEANVINSNNSSGKINILVAEDILEIAENMGLLITDQLERHSFKCPANMIDKMKIFIDLVKTDPNESDEILLKKVVPVSDNNMLNNSNAATTSVNDILNEMKSETVSEEDLGFLQSMNLTSLVREFEMEASGQGSQHLGILSLADDVPEHPFSELVPETEQHHQTNGNSLNDIEFE